MTREEMRKLIESVVDDFQRSTGVSVTEYAIDELYNPTLEHLDSVTRELREGRISEDFLRRSVRTVLENARTLDKDKQANFIGFKEVKASMDKECPYVFWC